MDAIKLKEFRKCEGGCGRYIFTVSQKGEESDWKERMRYCSDCWVSKISRGKTLREIEAENIEMPESEKQRQNSVEEYGDNNFRRYKAN